MTPISTAAYRSLVLPCGHDIDLVGEFKQGLSMRIFSAIHAFTIILHFVALRLRGHRHEFIVVRFLLCACLVNPPADFSTSAVSSPFVVHCAENWLLSYIVSFRRGGAREFSAWLFSGDVPVASSRTPITLSLRYHECRVEGYSASPRHQQCLRRLWSNVRRTGLFSVFKLVSPFGVTRFHQ